MALDEWNSAVFRHDGQGSVAPADPRADTAITTQTPLTALTVVQPPADDAAPTQSFWERNVLKLALVAGDADALLAGAFLGYWLSGYLGAATSFHLAVTSFVVAIAGVWAIRSQGLLLARNCAMRVVEITKLARACVVLGLVLLLADRLLKLGLHIEQAAAACTAMFLTLIAWRSVYRTSLAQARSRGKYLRPTIVVGADAEAARLIDLLITHRELGMEVLGLVGGRGDDSLRNLRDMWLGDVEDTEELVRRSGASGVIVSPVGIDGGRFNALIRNLQRDGVHVFVSTGLAGIEARRLRSVSLAHEPMLYVEPPKFNRAQSVGKRVFDIVVASLLLVLASPLMLLCAAAVKCCDRGPVFFRQSRVGQGGRLFKVLKFRTMSVDAEDRVHALSTTNERNGPLFKMAADPRVTRVGRWLRESSLDELPQLFNVLRGEMSLVGPRPALPAEVVQFSAELRTRELVLPGITGLWQVEARDNPSFEAYRRLDLFYVENWSITLDLLIVLATIEHIAVRMVTMVGRKFRRSTAPAPVLASADAA